MNQVLKDFLIARLLALVHRTVVHDDSEFVPKSIDAGEGRLAVDDV